MIQQGLTIQIAVNAVNAVNESENGTPETFSGAKSTAGVPVSQKYVS